jgi:hypothetical protein
MQISANIDAHWHVLQDLSNDDKLALVELLIKSMREPSVHTVSKDRGKSSEQINISKKSSRANHIIPKLDAAERDKIVQSILSYENANPSFGDAALWQQKERQDRELPSF